MQNDEILDADQASDRFTLNEKAIIGLKTSAKWAYFLSILGFVIIGLLVFFSLLMLFATSGKFNLVFRVGLFVLYMLVAVLYFLPIRFLYQFSEGTKRALHREDSQEIGDALQNLGKHYRFLGLFAIAFLAMYALFFIFGIMKLTSMGL